MRRLSRLDRPTDRLRPQPAYSASSFLCSACLRRAPFSTSSRCSAEPENIPKTEQLRRRIWGTDKPPGLEDPYGGPSIVEERQAARAIEKTTMTKSPKSQGSKTSSPVLDALYEPAKTWEGLEEVGELPPPEFYFEGFIPAEQVTDLFEATAALHRAVVEVFTLKQAGRPLSELSSGSRAIDKTSDVQISASQSDPSAPLLRFPENASQQALLDALGKSDAVLEDFEALDAVESPEDIIEPEATSTLVVGGAGATKDAVTDNATSEEVEAHQPVNYEQLVASWKSSWLQITLDDAEVKFAIVKRVMYLTGIRLSDSAINSVHSVRALLSQITQKPKPAKLFDALAERGDLVTLPNVKIFNRRITPIDKAMVVGRWKMIEKELESRGLPVKGRLS